jgi:HD-like signal output (HDOD) protein
VAKKKDYLPNNWQEYKDADDDMFIPHTFEELMSWKVANWELPGSVCCIIRITDLNTKKVTEQVYQKRSAAQQRVQQLMSIPDIEFTVVDHQSIHHLAPTTDD